MKNKTIHLSLIALLALICAYFGYDMVQRSQQELLWGYRPLFCALAGWGALVLTVKFFAGGPWQRLGLSTLSGVLLGIGFPDILPLPWLMFVGFVPLLLLEAKLLPTKGKAAAWLLFKHSYHAFVLWNVIATYWVANTAFIAGVFAIWVNALLMSVPFLLFFLTGRILPKLKYAALVCYWLTFEYIHLNWELTWPWLTLGNSLAEYPSLLQWYSYTGVFGGSLWVLLANVLALKGFMAYRAGQAFRTQLLQGLALLLLPIGLSLAMYFSYEEQGELREVAVVQPNFEPHYIKFNLDDKAQMEVFLKLSEQIVDENTDYLVFPETSFGLLESRNISNHPKVQQMRRFLAAYPQLKLVSGVDAYHIFQEGEPRSRALRTQVRGNGRDTLHYEMLNAAIQLDGAQVYEPLYRKSKLVPGPEIFPFKRLLFFMEPLVDLLDGTTAGVGTQPERSVFSSDAGRVAPSICYESIFGEYNLGYIHKGAQATFIMTNDGWWDNTAGHRQHLYFATLRAIETRRSIARSANTGISAFINQRGDIMQPTKYGEGTAIKQSIRFNDALTFYARWGDMIARIALFVAILLLLNSLARYLRGRGK